MNRLIGLCIILFFFKPRQKKTTQKKNYAEFEKTHTHFACAKTTAATMETESIFQMEVKTGYKGLPFGTFRHEVKLVVYRRARQPGGGVKTLMF